MSEITLSGRCRYYLLILDNANNLLVYVRQVSGLVDARSEAQRLMREDAVAIYDACGERVEMHECSVFSRLDLKRDLGALFPIHLSHHRGMK